MACPASRLGKDKMEEEIPEQISPDKEQYFKDEILKLKKQLREAYREQNLAEEVREKAFQLSSHPYTPPSWLDKESENRNGIPTLFISSRV